MFLSIATRGRDIRSSSAAVYSLLLRPSANNGGLSFGALVGSPPWPPHKGTATPLPRSTSPAAAPLVFTNAMAAAALAPHPTHTTLHPRGTSHCDNSMDTATYSMAGTPLYNQSCPCSPCAQRPPGLCLAAIIFTANGSASFRPCPPRHQRAAFAPRRRCSEHRRRSAAAAPALSAQ